ncbi:putative FtsX-related transmembrane transport protein [Fulvivirga imtechensis AK7]|uniref:Putative FtsX-related transmembrane transport protein n=1 Tax=Fulvivirga imtechensis AK7 TaxID=1237149 RepID=L8JTW7_9BACT|nr:ABC transporter permease [Fulvivirga imtechensis]ELR72446.1 putative FtsX-related transmembrane transport protein [Fulvivirga imtechensis AK7]
MFKNYLKIAVRNILKNKLYSFINIFGLGFGIACVLLIVLYVQDELSYDKFHDHAGDIYRVAWFNDNPQTRTPHPMAQAMVRDFPEVAAATTLSPIWGPGLTKQTFSVRNLDNDITYDERNVLGVDSTFFDVFSFRLTKGNQNEVLRNVGGLLLSESTARKYFGDDDPIGKSLAINDDETLLIVEGIFEDVPKHSHFHFDILVSYVTLKASNPGSSYYSWADFGHFNYIRLHAGSDPQKLEDQLVDWALGYVEVPEEEIRAAMENNDHFKLQPLTDIHLKSRIRWELGHNGNIEYIYIMTAAALFILIIACVNFMNLTTARSTERSKEIGIRKSLGAYKKQVSLQFLGESLLTAFLAMVLAGFMAEVSLPFFNAITNKSLDIEYIEKPQLMMTLLGCGLVTGLIAGLYPALFLSSIHPVISLKGIDKIKPKGAMFRKALLIFQFVISMVLICGSIVIYDQLYFIHNKDLGFEKERVITIPLKNYELLGNFDALKNELLTVPGVQYVSAASNIPGTQYNQNPIFSTADIQNRVDASEVFVDYDVFKTLGIEMIAGRGFSAAAIYDSANVFVINEKAAKNLGLEEPVGSEIVWEWDVEPSPMRGTVIGVVKDFNYQSLHQQVQPLLFKLRPSYNHVLLKLNSDNPGRSMEQVEIVWRKFEDRFAFDYSILSDDLSNQYISEEKTAQVFSGFSLVAVLIACFGLFGLASLSFSQRAKEVSIRKVLGASTSRILALLISDFTRLIALAIIIAVPLAWLLMSRWLENFTFKVQINPLSFLIAATALILLAWITVSYLTIKVASANPVDKLKEE